MATTPNFHGVQLGFAVVDPFGNEAIAVGGDSFAVGEVSNTVGDPSDTYRIDDVHAVLTHSDGTSETFSQMFPGPSTVVFGEAKQVLVQIKASATDVPGTTLVCVVFVSGANVANGNKYSGTWGIGVAVHA